MEIIISSAGFVANFDFTATILIYRHLYDTSGARPNDTLQVNISLASLKMDTLDLCYELCMEMMWRQRCTQPFLAIKHEHSRFEAAILTFGLAIAVGKNSHFIAPPF